MNRDIEQIECYYETYCRYNSFTTFSIFTDSFFDNIMSIEAVKIVVAEILKQYPIEDDVFESDSHSEFFTITDALAEKGYSYLIAYYIQIYQYWRKNNIDDYYNQTGWLTGNDPSYDENIQYFKTDFIRPIVDYIIYQLMNEGGILSVIRRYSERVERFLTIGNINEKKEAELQRDIALYLFDNGYEFYKEIDTCNGSIDLQIDDEVAPKSVWQCQKIKFIIEVKKFYSQSQIKKAIIQLRAYMNQIGDSKGCLVIYTMSPLFIATKPNDIHIQIVNVFTDTPSKLKKQTILHLSDD